MPVGEVHFIDFTYGGRSTGALTVPEAIGQAAKLADRVIALITEQLRVMA